MSIKADQLREDQQILVRGKIAFSRLASLIEGDALDKRIQADRARGKKYITTVPHTTISLVDAQILTANSEPTPEEKYVESKTYAIKSGDNKGKVGFSIDNKSNYLPTVLEQDPERENVYRQLILERDLATGLDVTLVLNTFAPKNHANKGLGLQQVVLNEPVRYYNTGVDTKALAERGIIIEGGIKPVSNDEVKKVVQSHTVTDDDGFAAPVANIEVSENAEPNPDDEVEMLRAKLAAAEAKAQSKASPFADSPVTPWG